MHCPIKNSLHILYIGRFVAGLSTGFLGITESMLIESWFTGNELSIAIKVDIAIARFSWGLSGIIQILYFNISKSSVSGFTLGLYATFLTLLLSIILIVIDTISIYPKVIKRTKRKDDQFSFQDFKIIPFHIWILALASAFFYIAFYCNYNICSGMLQDRFGHNIESASISMSLPNIISALLIPFFEALFNKLGMNSLILVGAYLLMSISHFAFSFLPQVSDPSYRCVVPLLFVGLSYSLFTSIFWRAINIALDNKLKEAGIALIT